MTIKPTITKTDSVRQHRVIDSLESARYCLIKALNEAETAGETDAMVAWQSETVGVIVSALNLIDPDWEDRR